MNLFDLTDHLLELLWAKLGEVSGSPAEAARSRWALYSTCKAFRDNPAIRAQWELQNHVVTDPDACAQELSLKIVGRVVRGLCLLGDFESFMDLFEALQGKERQAMRMQLESFTELQVRIVLGRPSYAARACMCASVSPFHALFQPSMCCSNYYCIYAAHASLLCRSGIRGRRPKTSSCACRNWRTWPSSSPTFPACPSATSRCQTLFQTSQASACSGACVSSSYAAALWTTMAVP